MNFDYRGGSWDLRERVRVVGILNVTPDSFYDGGRYARPEDAIARAEAMVAEGADSVDVGAQSTRPGAGTPLSTEDEWQRLEPVVAPLAARLPVPLSIDTYHAETARRALDQGAAIVNDVSGLTHEGLGATLVVDCLMAGLARKDPAAVSDNNDLLTALRTALVPRDMRARWPGRE